MLNQTAILSALNKLDGESCANALGADGLNDVATAKNFLDLIKQSGCLLLKLQNDFRASKRNQFIIWLRTSFSAAANSDLISDLECHINDAKNIERAFRQISKSLEESEIWKLAPDIQAWGILHRGASESQHLSKALEEVTSDWKRESKGFLIRLKKN
jgi:hypothetical protein